ncbi:hypothetical protein GCM10028791_42370 [Echinicola sediminis]
MKIIELDSSELIKINGGSAYKTGYKIGYWVGAFAATIRNVTFLTEDIIKDTGKLFEQLKP